MTFIIKKLLQVNELKIENYVLIWFFYIFCLSKILIYNEIEGTDELIKFIDMENLFKSLYNKLNIIKVLSNN